MTGFQGRVETERGEFQVERTGPSGGQTIVLVAGLGDDSSSWQDVVSRLSRSYDCVCFDNRGIGQSPITDGPYTTAQLADDAHGIAAALGLEQIVAVGSSMGGAICQEWALRHPDDLDALVLSNTWAARDTWLSGLMSHWIELAERQAAREILYQLALLCFSPRYLESHPGMIEEFLRSPVPDLNGFASAAHACRAHDAIDRLSEVDLPTLVIGGDYDILTRPDLSRDLAAAMPNAEVTMLPAGHMIFWEQVEAWEQAVNSFISRRVRTSAS